MYNDEDEDEEGKKKKFHIREFKKGEFWKKFWKKFKDYYSDFWNYADLVPPVLIITIILVDTFTTDKKHPGAFKFRITMQAIANFFMWLKVFYFLRIFRSTGYFVNMLVEVTMYIRTYLFLYSLILGAFSCSFFIM